MLSEKRPILGEHADGMKLVQVGSIGWIAKKKAQTLLPAVLRLAAVADFQMEDITLEMAVRSCLELRPAVKSSYQ